MYEALIILRSLIGFLEVYGRNYGKHKTRQTSKQEAHIHLHGCLENDDLENNDLENDDLENNDLENDLENDDIENSDLENDDLENDDLNSIFIANLSVILSNVPNTHANRS